MNIRWTSAVYQHHIHVFVDAYYNIVHVTRPALLLVPDYAFCKTSSIGIFIVTCNQRPQQM